ncbi:MAG: FHA domain-containing protein [Candidatus Obscuribacterales bacterium]|nr:FHA domain-containing protein [Candidatus Obscuribacterales bacterium]
MSSENSNSTAAFLLILESNRKIPVVAPECRLGRDDQNDIVISDDTSISRFHALITTKDGQYFVNDSKSRHGTFLNGNKLIEPARINDGDLLKIGSSIFWFVIEFD